MPSFGEELRRERELREITLREVSDATKISLRYLEALDRNDFKHLPGGVFNRGFVRAYAQYIGVDPEQMVTAYLHEEQAQQAKEERQHGAAGDSMLRGSSPPKIEDRTTSPAAGPAVPWVKLGLAVLIVAALIAGGFFVYHRFVAADPASEPARGSAEPPPAAAQPTDAPSDESSTDAAVPTDEPALPARSDRPLPTTSGPSEPASRPPVPEPAARPPASTATPPPSTAATDGTASPESVQVVVHIDRPTDGRLNCDNAQIEFLNGMPAGSRLELTCRRFLIVDADDGGALRIAWPGREPAGVAADGEALAGHRIDVPARDQPAGTGARP